MFCKLKYIASTILGESFGKERGWRVQNCFGSFSDGNITGVT
jgi:hypothetical protein